MRKPEEFRASKYSLSKFEESGSCRKRWWEDVVLKSTDKEPPSEQMIKGTYFETLCLGENTSGEELPDISFLYTAKGEPRVELTRIHEQVGRFKELFDRTHKDYIGVSIKDVQVLLEDDRDKGVLDILGEDEFGRAVIVDLKFTGDVDNERGDFAWGRDPNDINWDQFVLYKKLYQKLTGKPPIMMALVFDASPKKGIKLFEIKTSESTENDLDERIDYMMELVKAYSSKEPPVSPSESNCSTCKVDCSFRFQPAVLKKTKVYV